MCGILVAGSRVAPVDPGACARALSAMSWRGPDFVFGATHGARLFTGQTVLSITGRPQERVGCYHRSPSGRFEVYFNGEIYNFRELAARFVPDAAHLRAPETTDTEVLAALADVMPPEEIAGALDGMFAFVLLDLQTKRLHLARDPQGEKSLYIFTDPHRFVAASEIGAIRSLVPGLRVDLQAVRDYFRTRHFMHFERTAFEGVRQLPPGALLTIDAETFAEIGGRRRDIREWIDPDRLARNERRSADDLGDELDALLRRTVREMLPQRGYAAVVSGGVDSSLVARYLVDEGSPGMFVAVNHVGKDRISSDLSGFERALDVSIETLSIDAATYAAEVPRCQRICCAPLHSHSFVPQSIQSARVRSRGHRVLFGGDGADELFGGYDSYLTVNGSVGRFSPSPYMACVDPGLAFAGDAPARLEHDLSGAWRSCLDTYRHVASGSDHTVLAMTLADAAFQLPAVGLRGADLMSMMWSVETRSVFVRAPVIAFALNLPARFRVDPAARDPLMRTKPLLKRLFTRYYPSALLFDKQGFGGFPNESARYLGAVGDFVAPRALGLTHEAAGQAFEHRDLAWKLTNVEYFLRDNL